jgi:hypothetical protein
MHTIIETDQQLIVECDGALYDVFNHKDVCGTWPWQVRHAEYQLAPEEKDTEPAV